MGDSPIDRPYRIVQLSEAEATDRLPELADILVDVVQGGASVSFMDPFTSADATTYWQSRLPGIAEGSTLLLVALYEGRAVGTVQLLLSTPPNQPHRAEVAKLLVHRQARRLGIGRALMRHLETLARQHRRSLLTLDTCVGSAAEPLYESLGYVRLGIIPGYAYLPNGILGDAVVLYKWLDQSLNPSLEPSLNRSLNQTL